MRGRILGVGGTEAGAEAVVKLAEVELKVGDLWRWKG